MTNNKIIYSKKVERSLRSGKPVLALESTIISHGMPFPENLTLAKELEEIAEDSGVTPATVCLMNGFIKIGLNEDELNHLATNKQVKKVSRRDISPVLVNKETGATTVAATMVLAHLAGIKVFATGGIGGVHRFAETSFDISADLIELSRTPVIVVSAGAKAILDLNKTLEYLETFSVPVLGYKTDKFPAFYSRTSNIDIQRVDNIEEIVQIFETNERMGFNSGILVANPIPEKLEIPFNLMAKFIDRAVDEALRKNINGQQVTPFLLGKIVEITKGDSLKANVELVKNNVALGAGIAKKLID